MTTKGRFGGLDLGAIARTSQTETRNKTPIQARVPIGELAVKGAPAQQTERHIIQLADPRRCRPWRFHNRHASWYTHEECADIIDALAKQEQQSPALGRRLEGDPNYDFELIYGMRRRFACEVLNRPLKVRVVSISDQEAAVLMHQENVDRKDISPMERAISIAAQLREGLFANQDEVAAKLNVTKSMVSKMLSAAELFSDKAISELFPDVRAVPVRWASAVGVRLGDAAGREEIVKTAKELISSGKASSLTPTAILRLLLDGSAQTTTIKPFKKSYNIGAQKRMIVTRNNRGKVTLAFSDGLTPDMEGDVISAIRLALRDPLFK